MHTTWNPCSKAASGELVTDGLAGGVCCAVDPATGGAAAEGAGGGASRTGSLDEPGEEGSWSLKRSARGVVGGPTTVDAFFDGFLG